jgi:rRNA maturation endonuclease Nob1
LATRLGGTPEEKRAAVSETRSNSSNFFQINNAIAGLRTQQNSVPISLLEDEKREVVPETKRPKRGLEEMTKSELEEEQAAAELKMKRLKKRQRLITCALDDFDESVD